ncbi:hypothetical protein [Micavibrio aeruginosavorus]|uniref:hypothetical protein n=1 Tax=Micavibrio aeruginosavorus TaxID=349221 RepID=UPI003F4AD86A
MSDRLSLTSSFNPALLPLLDEDMVCAAWNKALKTQDHTTMCGLMQQGLSPDHPLNPLGITALHYLIQLEPQGRVHAGTIDRAVKNLLRSHADLLAPDYCGLLPADYALCSSNPQVAHTVILNTMGLQIKRGTKLFHPAIDRLFSILPDRDGMRLEAWNNLRENADMITDYINTAFSTEGFEPLLQRMSAKDYAYWQDPVQDRRFADLPAPTDQMDNLFEKFSFMRNNLNLRGTFSQYTKTHDLDAEFDAAMTAEQELRHAEYKHAKKHPRP